MDLTNVSKEALLAELERRRQEEEIEERKRRDRDSRTALQHIDVLLSLVPEHSSKFCSDSDPYDGTLSGLARCTRCFLVKAKRDKWWDDIARLEIHVRKLKDLDGETNV